MDGTSPAFIDREGFRGVVPGTQSLIEIRCSQAITGVDEVLRPRTADEPLRWPNVSPGFIDLQVNGFAGVDYNDPETSTADVARSIQVMYSTGVTRCFPTIITGSEQRIVAAIRNLREAKEELARSGEAAAESIAGLHIEGPHLSPEEGPRGAHPVEHIRPPDIAEFDRWQAAADGLIRLVTISPEWDGAAAYVRHLIRSGVVASVGHTKATRSQIAAAVDAGATMSTHLGNAAHPMLPKTANYLWNQLAEDRLAASFIVDGIHIPGDFLRAAIRAKGAERSVLVTDAVMPAMCSPGPYQLGRVAVELLADHRVVMRGGDRLAGSALRMDHAIGNCVRMAQLPLRDALAMATVNAARAGRIAGRQRGLTPGEKADLVFFDWEDAATNLKVLATVVQGHVVYRSSHSASTPLNRIV